MTCPPQDVIDHAIIEARRSPCSKSKRGAAIFTDISGILIALGHNRMPRPYACDGSAACRASCAKACLHAEQVAIERAVSVRQGWPMRGLEMLHVKLGADGTLVAGGKPSCWQCARLVLEHGLPFWLYESNRKWYSRDCGGCAYIHEYGDHSTDGSADLEKCPACGHELNPISKVIHSIDGTWRNYSPQGFFSETAIECGVHVGRAR